MHVHTVSSPHRLCLERFVYPVILSYLPKQIVLHRSSEGRRLAPVRADPNAELCKTPAHMAGVCKSTLPDAHMYIKIVNKRKHFAARYPEIKQQGH